MKKIVLILAAIVFAGISEKTEAATRRPHAAIVRAGGAHWHVGMRSPKRPHRSVVIRFGGLPYYYAAGAYFRRIDKSYEAVRPEIGMQVPELPEYGVRIIETDDGTRFIYDGVIYKAVPTKKGVKYAVVGFVE